MADFFLRRGDRTSPLRRTLVDFDGNPIDLTSKTVKFYLANAQTEVFVVNGSVITPVDAVNGVVQYEWEPGTTDVAGNYLGEFTTTDPDGLVQSFPNAGYIEVQITKRPGDL